MTQRSESSGVSTGVLEDTGGYHTDSTGAWQYNFDIWHTRSVDHRNMRGEEIPDFHAKRRSGALIPYTRWHQFEVSGKTDGSRHNALKNYPLEQDFYSWWSGKNGWILHEAELKEISDKYSEYRGIFVSAAASSIYSQGHDSLTFIAELGKTVKMFRGALRRVIRLASSGQLAKLWLEGRYGWRLVYYDIKDISEAIATLDDQRTRFKQRVGDTFEETVITDLSSESNWENWYGSIVTDYTISVRGNVIADISPPKFAFNPLVTGWEIIPYSFVIDWFVNVGSWLEAMSFLTLQSNYYAAGGTYVKAKRVLSVTGEDSPYNTSYTSSSWQESTCEATLTERLPTEVPYQPSIQVRLDAYKVTDLIALLLEAVTRR